MENLYVNYKGINNSWFTNNSKVVRVEKNSNYQHKNKEKAYEIKSLFPQFEETIIFIEGGQREVSSLCPRSGHLEYHYYTIVIKGKDHCKASMSYRFIIGQSQVIGVKDTEAMALRELQFLLMEEGIGVLKKETKLEEIRIDI